jgi:uncharacterized tellurite resistance protein B-like protein
MLWVICGAVGAVFSGFVGMSVGLVFGLILATLIGKGHKSGRNSGTPSQRVTTTRPPLHSKETVSAQSVAPKPFHAWKPPDQPFRHAGFVIPGMVYTSSGNPTWESEPSAIYLNQSVGTPAASNGREIPYWPSYANLSENQRATYLEWLSQGKKVSDISSVETGYIFLFFYGIERRVLVDGDLDLSLIQEVCELLKLYGDDGRSGSLVSYLGDFLHYTAYNRGIDHYVNAIPVLLELCGNRASELALTMILGSLHARCETLDWSLAFRLARSHEMSKRSVVIGRTGETFSSLFKKRYEEKYPAGLSLRAGKNSCKVSYRPANASLSFRSHQKQDFSVQVPNVLGLRAQFNELPKIWNTCIDELSGFSRAIHQVGKSGNSDGASLLKVHLALPEEMRSSRLHPLFEKMNQLLEASPKETMRFFLPVRALADLIMLPDRPTFTAAQSNTIAELVESMGYGIAPDPRLLGLPLAGSQEVAVVKTKLGVSHTPEILGLLRLLYLSVAIAAVDGTVNESELTIFRDAVEKRVTDPTILEMFTATTAALLRDTGVASRLVSKIAKGVKLANRPTVFRLLVHIAGSDEIITSDERRALVRIANAFALPATLLDDILEEDREFATVTVSGKKASPKKGESLLPRASEEPEITVGFSLDMARISAITSETDQVVKMLAEVLADEEAENKPPTNNAVELSNFPEWMENLDPAYRPALVAILAEGESLGPLRLAEISTSMHLLPVAIVDIINSWSDEELGDFLLEEGEEGVFSIYREILPEILTSP